MAWYKTLEKRLNRCGWWLDTPCTLLALNQPAGTHIARYVHEDSVIDIIAALNKDGTPGKVLRVWRDGISVTL